MISRVLLGRASFLLSLLLILACSLSLVSCSLLGPAMRLGMVKLKFGCLPEGTMIDGPNGAVRIEELEVGDEVIGYGGEIVVVRRHDEYVEDVNQVRHLKVVFNGGEVVRLSPGHRIGGIPAGDLKVGDRVGERVVSRVERLGGVSRSFDLLTDDEGYRVEGVPVNSMIQEMAEEMSR